MSIFDSFLDHASWKISRLERKKFNRFPFAQNSNMTQSFEVPLVHAPSKLTMFLCSPKCIKIFSSDVKSLYWLRSCWSKIESSKIEHFLLFFSFFFYMVELQEAKKPILAIIDTM